MKITITNPLARPYWRGGMQHPPGEHSYPADHLGPEQLAAIEADPHLSVSQSTAAPAAKPAKKKAAKA